MSRIGVSHCRGFPTGSDPRLCQKILKCINWIRQDRRRWGAADILTYPLFIPESDNPFALYKFLWSMSVDWLKRYLKSPQCVVSIRLVDFLKSEYSVSVKNGTEILFNEPQCSAAANRRIRAACDSDKFTFGWESGVIPYKLMKQLNIAALQISCDCAT